MIKTVDLIVSMHADSFDIFFSPERVRTEFEKWHDDAVSDLDKLLAAGYTIIAVSPVSYSGNTSIIFTLHKADETQS